MGKKQCSSCSCKLDIDCNGNDFCRPPTCSCFLCPLCAMVLVANRKFNLPKCATCKKTITELRYYRSDRSSRHSCESISVIDHEPDLDRDPVRYYASHFRKESAEEKGKKFILSLSFPLPKEEDGEEMTSSSLTACLDGDFGPESLEDELNLRQIFSILYIPLFNQNKDAFKRSTFDQMTALEYQEYAAFEDPSLILKLLFAFATGEMQLDSDEFQINNRYRSQFMAVAVAKEMLQNITLGRPGPFQLMMSHQMEIHNVNSELKAYLSSIRVTGSITHLRNRSLAAQKEAARMRIATDPLDTAMAHFDNLGFKGRKNLWSQHCIIQVKPISKHQLKCDGFYKARLSRKRLDFRDLALTKAGLDMDDVEGDPEGAANVLGVDMDTLARKVVGTTKKDRRLLSKRVMTSIDCAVSLELPDLEQCYELDEMNELSWKTRIPLNLSNTIVDPQVAPKKNVHQDGTAADTSSGMINSMAKRPTQKLQFGQPTIYEANDIYLDNPLHEDPNATNTVIKIMEYLEKVSEWDSDNVDYEETNGEDPVRDIMAAATCDGSPMKRFLDIIDRDKRRSREEGCEPRFQKVRFFMGGMHFLMEVANMSNRLSRDFLEYFVIGWRPTEPQVNWLLSVSDPTDFTLEMPQYLLAHYRAAVDAVKAKNEGGPVTAADVHEHMISRAEEFPVCMAVLLNLRFIEIALMVRDSEKSGDHGDVDLFLTTIRLALPIFAASHATNYMHICCDMLEWWKTASEADKVLFRKHLFTQKSPSGKPIWADRAVEWTMRHIRMFLGKYARTNQNKRLDRVIPNVPFRMASKRDLRALSWRENNLDMYSSVAFNLQKVGLSKVYVKTYLKVRRANLWGRGQLQGDFFDENYFDEIDDPPKFQFPLVGEEGLQPMSSAYLAAYETGENRVRNYYKTWHIQYRHSESRKGLNQDLKLIPSQSSVRKDEIEKMRVVKLSVKSKELQDLKNEFPKLDIKRDLDHLRETHYPQIPPIDNIDRISRKDIVKLLCKWRRRYFKDFPGVYEEYLERAQAVERYDNCADFETTERQLRHFIFALEPDVVEKFR